MAKKRVQLRVDLLNVFNHPNFRTVPIDSGTDLFGSLPNETVITAAEYDAWARVHSRPLSTTGDGAAVMQQIQQLVIGNRLPSGALPADFFHVQLPQGFATLDLNAYDVTTLDGYKSIACASPTTRASASCSQSRTRARATSSWG